MTLLVDFSYTGEIVISEDNVQVGEYFINKSVRKLYQFLENLIFEVAIMCKKSYFLKISLIASK